MNTRWIGSVLCALSVGVVAPTAMARGEAMQACRADVVRLCPDVKPGGGRILECMKAHEADLSEECKAAVAARKAEWEPVREACRQDAETLCPGLAPGKGLFRCMKDHQADVSQACKDAVAPLKARWEARRADREQIKADCRADRERLCGSVTRKDHALGACMKAHAAELSDACRAHFADANPTQAE